jgi:hypothetical protein
VADPSFYFSDTPVSMAYLTTNVTVLSFLSYLFGICHGSPEKTWSDKRFMACPAQNTFLSSLGQAGI